MSNLLLLERRKKIAGQQETRSHDQNRKKDPDVHLAHSSSAAFEVAAFRASCRASRISIVDANQ
jgi:hypothetical protein